MLGAGDVRKEGEEGCASHRGLSCLVLCLLMPAGRPWQAGAGLLGLFASTFFQPFSFTGLGFYVFWFVNHKPKTTQLATQVQQGRIQMVRSNNIARMRLMNQTVLPQWTHEYVLI